MVARCDAPAGSDQGRVRPEGVDEPGQEDMS
jgi:hypothetical protein